MRIKSKIRAISVLGLSLLTGLILIMGSSRVSATIPYIAERVNLTPSGTQMTNGNTQDPPMLSQDGRYVAFTTTSSDIVSGDTNNAVDVFVRDRKLGSTTRATLSSTGSQLSGGGHGYGDGYSMSANGRFVIFSYGDASVVPGDTNGKWDIFLRDLKNNTTEMVSLTSSGGLPNGDSTIGDISTDGRYVVFSSNATNLVPGDTNGKDDVFIRDRKLGTTTLLSKSNAGVLGDSSSIRPSISCDGSYVTFKSWATNLVSGDTNAKSDVFLVDRVADDSITNITINGNADSGGDGFSDISCNGETIVFSSEASNLVLNDTNNAPDIFAYKMIDNSFDRVNVDSAGNQTVYAANPSGSVPPLRTNSVDFSGRYVIFSTITDTLVSGDTNNTSDVFLRDIKDGTTQIVSKRNATTQTSTISETPSISLDGRSVTFTSWDAGLVSGDTNGIPDFFVSQTGI